MADGTVFGTHGDEVVATDADSGEARWTFSLAENSLVSPIVADETLYIGDDSGTLYGIKTGGGTGFAGKRFDAVETRPRWPRSAGSRRRGRDALCNH
ncbi:hypothetical protein GCM10009000_048030 [Halobacterium noricense]